MSTQGSVRRDASGNWYFVVDLGSTHGKRNQVKRRGFATKKEAQESLTRLLGDAQRGTVVRPTRLTVAEYLVGWLAALPVSGRRESTIAGYRHLIERNVIPALGNVELQNLRAIDLDALYADLLAGRRPGLETKRLAKSSVRKIHTILGRALGDAERKGIVMRNVARSASAPSAASATAPEMTVWMPSQLALFLRSIDGHHHYPLIRLAAMSGMRRGELCGVRWDDIDLENGTVVVRRAVTVVEGRAIGSDVKTRRSRRTIDLDGTTVATLRRLRRDQLSQRVLIGAGWTDSGLAFTTPTGTGWHPDTISQAFDRLVVAVRKGAKFDLPRVRFHDLRHTHASHLLAAGTNVKVVSERLGHASVAFTLDVYAHVMPGQQSQAANAVATLVDGAL